MSTVWGPLRRSLLDNPEESFQAAKDLRTMLSVQPSHGSKKPMRLKDPSVVSEDTLKGVLAILLLAPYNVEGLSGAVRRELVAIMRDAAFCATQLRCEGVLLFVLTKGGHATPEGEGSILKTDASNPRYYETLLLFQQLVLSYLSVLPVGNAAALPLAQIIHKYSFLAAKNTALWNKFVRFAQRVSSIGNTVPVLACQVKDESVVQGLTTKTDTKLWILRSRCNPILTHTFSVEQVKTLLESTLPSLLEGELSGPDAVASIFSVLEPKTLCTAVQTSAGILEKAASRHVFHVFESLTTACAQADAATFAKTLEKIVSSLSDAVANITAPPEQVRIFQSITQNKKLASLVKNVLKGKPCNAVLKTACSTGPVEVRGAACCFYVLIFADSDLPTQLLQKELPLAGTGDDASQPSRRALLSEILPAADSAKLSTTLTSLWSGATSKVVQRADALLSLRAGISLGKTVAAPISALIPHVFQSAVLEKISNERAPQLVVVDVIESLLLSDEASWHHEQVFSSLAYFCTSRFGSVQKRIQDIIPKALAKHKTTALTAMWNTFIEFATGINLIPDTSAPAPAAADPKKKTDKKDDKKKDDKKGGAAADVSKNRRACWDLPVATGPSEDDALMMSVKPKSFKNPLTGNLKYLYIALSKAVIELNAGSKSDPTNATMLAEVLALSGNAQVLNKPNISSPNVPKKWNRGKYDIHYTPTLALCAKQLLAGDGYTKIITNNADNILAFLVAAVQAPANTNLYSLRDSAARAIPTVLNVLGDSIVPFTQQYILPLFNVDFSEVSEADVVESVALEDTDLLSALIAYEQKEEQKNQSSVKEAKARTGKTGYSKKDEEWEKQLKKELAEKEAGVTKDHAVSDFRDKVLTRLNARQRDLENTTFRPLLAAFSILLEMSHSHFLRGEKMAACIPILAPQLVGLMSKQGAVIARVTLLNVETISRLLVFSCDKEFAGMASSIAILMSRLFTRTLDPTRSKYDNDVQFTDTMLLRIRAAAKHAVSTPTFCLLFPIARFVLLAEKTVFQSKSSSAAPKLETQTVTMVTKEGKTIVIEDTFTLPSEKKFSHVKWSQQQRPLPKVAFSQTTQQVALMLITTNCGAPDIAFRTDIVAVLVHVMTHIAALHKSACQALCSVSANLTPNEFPPLLECLYNSYPAVKEAALATLKSFPLECQRDPATLASLRRALFVNSYEEHLGISRKAHDLFEQSFKFTVEEEDAVEIAKFSVHEVSSNRSAAAKAIGIIQQKFPTATPRILEQLITCFKDAVGECRVGVANTLELMKGYDGTTLLTALEFTLAQGLKDTNEDVQGAFLTSGRNMVTNESAEHYDLVMKFLQKKFDGASTGNEIQTSTLIVFMSTMLVIRHAAADLPTVLTRLMDVICSKASARVQQTVCECIRDISKVYGKVNPAEFKKLIQRCLDTLFTQKQGQQAAPLEVRRGCSVAVAGAIAGLGLRSIKEYNLVNLFETEVAHKAPPHRESALFMFASLVSVLRSLFEPYAIEEIQLLVASYSDKDSHVRAATHAAAKELMSALTDFGVHQIVPRLIDTLDSTSWRTKVNVMQLLGSMTFCSTKQLAAALPTVIPKLIVVLTDTHEDVSQSAFDAIRRFGSIISCEEIREHVEVLLTALRSPGTETENALDALLFTRFFSTIDIASLSLIMPVLLRGLKERSTAMKMKAAQISGSVTQLVADPTILAPYTTELMERLHSALFEPAAECQLTAAKAISSLFMALGERRYPQLIQRFLAKLADPSIIPSERSGSAKGLAECLGAMGIQRLNTVFTVLEVGFKSENSQIRDGHAQILIHLPRTMGAEYQNFIPRALPCLLSALADTNEVVRSTALTAGQTLVSLYGAKCMHILLPPLKEGLLGSNPRVRESSLHLVSELLIRVCVPKAELIAEQEEDEDEEDEEEDEEDVDAVVQKQEKERKRSARQARAEGREGVNSRVDRVVELIGEETTQEVFAAVYLMRMDASKNVRNSANQLWRTVVRNAASMLMRIQVALGRFIARLLWSGDDESESTGEKAISAVLSKIGDPALLSLYGLLRDRLLSKPEYGRPGCYNGLSEAVRYMSKTLFATLSEEVIKLLLEGINDPDEEIRAGAGLLMDMASRAGGMGFTEIIVRTLLKMVKESESNMTGYVSMFEAKPKLILQSTINVISENDTMEPICAKLFTTLIENSMSEDLFAPHLDSIKELIRASLIEDRSEAPAYLEAFGSLLSICDPDDVKDLLKDVYSDANGAPEAEVRCAGLLLLVAYAETLHGDDDEWKDNMSDVLTVVVRSYGDTDAQVLKIALDSLQRLSKHIDKCAADDSTLSKSAAASTLGKDNHAGLVYFFSIVDGCIRATHQGACLTSGGVLPGAEQAGGLDPVLPFYLNTVIQGTSDQKIAATQGLGALIHTVSPTAAGKYVSAIVGRLVRITFEKPPQIVVLGIVEVAAVLAEHIPPPAFKLHVLSTLQVVCQKALPDEDPKLRLVALKYLAIIAKKHGPSVNLDLAVKHISEAMNAAQSKPAILASIARGFTLLIKNRTEPLTDKSYALTYPLLQSVYQAGPKGTTACVGKAFGLCFSAKSHPEEQTKEWIDTITKATPNTALLSFVEGLVVSKCPALDLPMATSLCLASITGTIPGKPFIAMHGIRLCSALLRVGTSKEAKGQLIDALVACLQASIKQNLDGTACVEQAGWEIVELLETNDTITDKTRRGNLLDLRPQLRRSDLHGSIGYYDPELEAELLWAPPS